MQLVPTAQMSGSLKARTALVLYFWIARLTFEVHTEVRSEAVDQSMGTKEKAGL